MKVDLHGSHFGNTKIDENGRNDGHGESPEEATSTSIRKGEEEIPGISTIRCDHSMVGRENANAKMSSQVQMRTDEKPRMEMKLKLRCSVLLSVGRLDHVLEVTHP